MNLKLQHIVIVKAQVTVYFGSPINRLSLYYWRKIDNYER